MKKKERLVLRVDEGLMERVRVEAGVMGVGVSEWVRDAIEGKLTSDIPMAGRRALKAIEEPVLVKDEVIPVEVPTEAIVVPRAKVFSRTEEERE